VEHRFCKPEAAGSSPAPGLNDFSWKDGERWVIFRTGLLADAPRLLRERGWEEFELLGTPRALATAPGVPESAAAVHEVAPGGVPKAAGSIIEAVRATDLVALGGGRVIDAAKAIAAVRGGRVCAIPTTLSGAPMTAIHRLPEGHEASRLVRPALVLADPEAMTSLPEQPLRATAINALAHGADSLYTPLANPVAELAALRGAAQIAVALDRDRAERDRAALALGAILCGYAVDSTGFALHHVLCQTLVRVCGIPHAETYAVMLPRTMEAMRDRAPAAIASLAEAIGTDPERIGERIEALGGGPRRLGELGADPACRAEVIEVAMRRDQLAMTPSPPGPAELAAILESAW
jgi:alcohol dehydrogenase class IV